MPLFFYIFVSFLVSKMCFVSFLFEKLIFLESQKNSKNGQKWHFVSKKVTQRKKMTQGPSPVLVRVVADFVSKTFLFLYLREKKL